MNIDIISKAIQLLGFTYQIESPLIKSGQRKVYIASDLGSKKKVVIKISPPDPLSVPRIQREIKVLESLNSKYFPKILLDLYLSAEIVADLYDIDPIFRDNLFPVFITVEEYIHNTPWLENLDKMRDPDHLISFFIECFYALSQIWEKKIVHRDLKPPNILITNKFKPVIIDFGIAKSLRTDTQDITPVGFDSPKTWQFAAPEQIENRKDIDYRTDQYAIGILIFWALTGKFPFGRFDQLSPQEILINMKDKKYLVNIIDERPDLPEALTNLIRRLLEPQMYKRFRKPESIITALKNI